MQAQKVRALAQIEKRTAMFKLLARRKEIFVKRKELIPPTKLSKFKKHPPDESTLDSSEANQMESISP